MDVPKSSLLLLMVSVLVCCATYSVGQVTEMRAEHVFETNPAPAPTHREPAPRSDEPMQVISTPLLEAAEHHSQPITSLDEALATMQAIIESEALASAVASSAATKAKSDSATAGTTDTSGDSIDSILDDGATAASHPQRSLLQYFQSGVDSNGCTAADRRRAGLGFVVECLQPEIDYEDRLWRRFGFRRGRGRRRRRGFRG